MKTLDKITIENYESLEIEECNVNGTIVSLNCESEGDDYWDDDEEVFYDEYPYKYIVSIEYNGKYAEGVSWQRNQYESAFYDGFVPAYKQACKALSIKPSF